MTYGPDEWDDNMERLLMYWQGVIGASKQDAVANVWEDYVQPARECGKLEHVTYDVLCERVGI